MTAAELPPAYVCTPEELQWAGVQPVICTWQVKDGEYVLDEQGNHQWSPVVGVTGGVPWPQPWSIPDVPYRLAFRPPPNAWVMDVDDHDGQGQGPATLAAMEERLGPLPPTWRLSARGAHNPAGRRLYRIPPDLLITDAAFKPFGGAIESVRTGHRFSWAPGDINPKTGTPVECFGPDGNPTTLPPVSQWPELPSAWVALLRTAPQPLAKAPDRTQLTATGQFMTQEPPQRLSMARAAVSAKLHEVATSPGREGMGFRNTLMRAAMTLGGYAAGAPEHFDRSRLEEALYDAVTQVWGSVDASDALWIEQGLTDGAGRPFRVYDETQPYQLPDNVVQMPGVPAQPWVPQQPAYQPDGDHVDPLSWLRSKLITAAGLKSLPAPEPLVERLLFTDTLAWLIGAPGHAKSFLAVDLACSIATGTPWNGHNVKQGPVLYLVAEGVTGAGQRVAAWEQHHGKPADGVHFLPYPLQLAAGGLLVEPFQQLVAELQPRLVVVDTQARTSVGVDENSAKDVGVLISNLDGVRTASPETTVLILHHTPRGSTNPRGSTSIEGAADTILLSIKDENTVTVKVTKQKDAPEAVDQVLQLAPSADSAVLVGSRGPDPSSLHATADAIYRQMCAQWGVWTLSQIVEAAGVARTTTQRHLKELEQHNLVSVDRTTTHWKYTAIRREGGGASLAARLGMPAPQPVQGPVDNPLESGGYPPRGLRLGAHDESGHPPTEMGGPAQGAHKGAHEETAGQEGVPTGAQVGAHQLPRVPAHTPTLKGWAGPGPDLNSGQEESVSSEDLPPAGSEPQALPDMPEPAPKKRAEPRPGTKAYERAQAKAAEKAERIALAAGGSVQYPAVVLRDGQVLESPLSTAEELLSGLSELTVDVESSGVPIGHKDYELRLVQLGNDEFAVDLDPKDPAQMELAARVLAAAPVLHAHSSTADIVPLAHAGYVDFDSAMERMDDTAIRAKLNDPQSTGSDAGLKRISDYMLGADSASTPAEEARAELFKANGWLSEPKADTPMERNGWYQVDPACKTFARYGGSDVLDTALIAKRLAQIPPHIAARENAVAHMVSRIALKGIKLNGALIGDLMTEHVMKRDEWAKTIQSWTSIDNVGSDKQVAQALLGMGVRLPYTKPSTRFPDGQPSVAAGVLETLQGELDGTGHPAATLIEQVLTWRHHDTAITLFLTPYSVLVNDGDGRARPTVYTLGADTGRMSCTRPNIQQLPREGGFRAMFVADEGMTFISADFSSVEIRVAAALSQDQVLIRMLEEGLDPHAMAAAIVYGPDFTKAQRYAVKRGVFGRIYGGGVSTLAAQMRVSVAIAQKLIDAIDTLWPTLSAWSKASTQAVERGLETTFTTYSGRVVHLPKKAAHAAGNYKIQGTARELLVDALMRWRETKWGKAIMWPVHDELDVMVPIEDAEAATAELVRCMETELLGVRIVAEPSAPSPVWQDAA